MTRGILNIAIDLEFMWGNRDFGNPSSGRWVVNGYRRIDEVLDLFREYNVPATWAIVGALVLADRDDYLRVTSPSFRRDDPGCEPAWFHRAFIERIIGDPTGHEIGSHSFSHLLFGTPGVTAEMAEEDFALFDALVRERLGRAATSFVFPRHCVGYPEQLKKHGFDIYRGELPDPFAGYPPLPQKALRFLVRAFALTPALSRPTLVENDLLHLPASMFFGLREGLAGKLITPGRLASRAMRGIFNAAREGGIFSMYFHDHDFGMNPDGHLQALREVLACAAALREKGRLAIMTMREISGARASLRGLLQ